MDAKKYLLTLLMTVSLLVGCSSGSGVTDPVDNEGTDYPNLTSKPQISYSQNVNTLTAYDVTVTLEADGPTGVSFVELSIYSIDEEKYVHIDLQSIGGTTWAATTDTTQPLPAGNYLIDLIRLEDADVLDEGLVNSSLYFAFFLNDSHYTVDQRLTNYAPMPSVIVESNLVGSNSEVTRFTLP